MFERFAHGLSVSPAGQITGSAWLDDRLTMATGYLELMDRFAGCTFNDGLYRFHDAASGPAAAVLIAGAFPAFASRACPFGHDWLGRQFALDSARLEHGEPLVLLMEPGTGEVLEIPLVFASFHENLFELREPALAAGFFVEWTGANPSTVPLAPGQCVGYRVPLFLGGQDTADNLEVIDIEVYWNLCAQLRSGTLQLPPDTSISGVSIST